MTKHAFYSDPFVQRSLKRIQEQHIEVYGEAMNSDGQRIWFVSSSEQALRDGAGRGYIVTLSGHHLYCNCLAGERGPGQCKHAVAVCDRIIQETEAIKQAAQADKDEYEKALDEAAARIRRKEQLRNARKARA